MAYLKVSLTVVLLLMLAASLPAFGSGFQASAQMNRSWLAWAAIAWRYFQPGVGVNPTTGLSRANLDWNYATDWDTASYIISVIMAKRIGLIGETIPAGWGYRDRINKILSALESRPLGVKNGIAWPYWAYDWDGSGCGGYCGNYTGAADSGRLLAALNMLRSFDPSYAHQVDAVYERARGAYDVMAHQFDVDYYGYYFALAYQAWGYTETASLQGFEELKDGPTVNVYGVRLPTVTTVAEPMVLGLLELNRSLISPSFTYLAGEVYDAQEARYSYTGLLTAWSEGEYFEPPYYVYEMIYYPNAPPPGTWVIPVGSQVFDPPAVRPIMYTKVAFAYLAIYGPNLFTNALTGVAAATAGPYGFGEGTFEDGSMPAWSIGSFYSDKTNGLILDASAYVLTGGPPVSTGTTSSSISANTVPVPEFGAQTLLVAVTAIVMTLSTLVAKLTRRRRRQPVKA